MSDQMLLTSFDLQTALMLAHASYAAYEKHPTDYHTFTQYGFREFFCFVGEKKYNETTHGFLAVRDDLIILAFRGSNSVQDWITNLHFRQIDEDGAMVHQGFSEMLASVWSQIEKRLSEMQTRKLSKIFITGHSLGGALATLATRRVAKMGLTSPLETYTFGQPRVGDRSLRQQMMSPFYRLVYYADPMPYAPFSVPKSLHYKHVGTLKQINANGTVTDRESHFFTHLVSTVDSVRTVAEEWFSGNLRAFLMKRLKDHFMPNYLEKIECAINKQKQCS